MALPDYTNYPVFSPSSPPPPRKKKFAIFNTIATKENLLTPRQRQVTIVGRHWDDAEERSILCAGEDGSCPFDHEQQNYRWTGYLLCDVAPITDRKGIKYSGVVILHITPGACDSCPLLRDKSVNLLRYLIRATREGKTDRSPVKMQLYGEDLHRRAEIAFDLMAYIRETFAAPNNLKRRSKKGGSAA